MPPEQLRHKDFSYESGERQTSKNIGSIREDHLSRYKLAAALLKPSIDQEQPLTGIDVFCGNGYGSWLLSRVLGAHMIGIDGSDDAINVANRHFSSSRTVYSHKIFPFELPKNLFDFATCFESIEHVEEPRGLFEVLCKTIRPGGIILVSTPNEETMPLGINAAWFKHHKKHFTPSEMLALSDTNCKMEHLISYGQKAYLLDERGAVIGIDQNVNMQPSRQCENPQFLISVYRKVK